VKKILCLLLLCVFIPVSTGSVEPASDQIANCMLQSGYTYVSLKKNINNDYEVRAKINGSKEVTLVVNFNFSETFLSKEFMDMMDIPYKKMNRKYQINDDEDDLFKTTVDSINIGNGKTPEEELLVLDFEEFDYLNSTDAAGLLGKDFLIKYHAIFDFPNQRLFLKTEK